jgi:iron complex outermembrane receptor protein
VYYLIEDTYRKEDRDLFTLIDGEVPPVATREFDDEWNKTNSLGVFGEIEYNFAEKTSVSLGLRYSRDDKDFDIMHWGEGPLAVLVLDENPVIASGLSETWDAVTGKIALTHDLTETSMFYANVSTGYKTGGFGTQPPTLETAKSTYNEENVVNYEIGAKAEWLNRRLRTNIALFKMEHDDIQTQEFSESGSVIYTNAGKAETSGIEVEFQAAVTRYFTLLGSYSNYDAEYQTEELADQNFANMPDWTANLSGILETPLSSGALMRFRADYRGRSDIWHDPENDPVWGIRPGVDIFNARISYVSADGRWELALWGKNLTEEAEITNLNTQAFMSQRSVGYGNPRTYGLSLSLRN